MLNTNVQTPSTRTNIAHSLAAGLQRVVTLGIGLSISCAMWGSAPSSAAEYRGQRLDGRFFEAIAVTDNQSENVKVTFNGYQAMVHFQNGNYIIVDLDSVVIEDRENITGIDRRLQTEWKLALK